MVFISLTSVMCHSLLSPCLLSLRLSGNCYLENIQNFLTIKAFDPFFVFILLDLFETCDTVEILTISWSLGHCSYFSGHLCLGLFIENSNEANFAECCEDKMRCYC